MTKNKIKHYELLIKYEMGVGCTIDPSLMYACPVIGLRRKVI